jgi:hypothetical protein
MSQTMDTNMRAIVARKGRRRQFAAGASLRRKVLEGFPVSADTQEAMPYALIALVVGLLAAPLPAPAQAPAAGGAATVQASPDASFPLSKFRFTRKDAEVNLTWEEAAGFSGRVAVYRSAEAFSVASLPKATKIAELAPGTKKYSDVPRLSGSYYYAILPLGLAKPSFQNGRNATGSPIVVELPAKVLLPEPSLAARVEEDSVIVEYVGPAGSDSLLLYRGTAPLVDATSLLTASVVATLRSSDKRFIDYPVPGIDYWYALLPEEELKAGRVSLVQGVSATPNPVRIPAEVIGIGMAAELPYSRTPPLPSFYLDRAISSSSPLFAFPGERPPARELAPETVKAISGLLAGYPSAKPSPPSLVLLAAEQGKPTGGEDYALALIVREKLIKGENADAADQLRRYLSLNRGADAQARARFYLGVALSRIGEERAAIFEFLAAREAYPRPTGPWIDYLMLKLRRGE